MSASILLVDDNAVQAAIRQTILKRAGYHVMAALNPERALELLRSDDLAAPIGLVITDHIMPGMSGSVFIRKLRETLPKMPVLVISGLEEAEAEYTDLDVVFRVKPILPDNLLATVARMLAAGEQTAQSA